MKNTISALVIAVVVLVAGRAWAGGQGRTLGLGAEIQLSGLAGISANYDMGPFHFGGLLGFSDDGGTDDTDANIGARFYYHLHSSAMSDFGVGGQLGLAFVGDRMPNVNNNAVNLWVEPGFQLRAFIANNVALSFSAGIRIGLADANGFELLGQGNAGAGVHYYFF